MKRMPKMMSDAGFEPAAFRRLCVETKPPNREQRGGGPAAFRRLCVETYCPDGMEI